MSIETLLSEIESIEIDIKKEMEKNFLKNTISTNTYNKMLEKIVSLKNNACTNYSLVFIGEKGVGKTTNICKFLNLVQPVQKRKKGKNVEVIEEILQTGSGATTICDIEIAPSLSGKTQITIEEISDQDLFDYLQSFAEYLFSRAHKESHKTGEIDESVPLPPEIERACRNITNLKETKEYENRIDNGVELARGFTENQISLFVDEVFSKANLEMRTQKTFSSEINLTGKEEMLWIKSIFKDLNLGKIDTAPLPKVIKIYLSKEIFDFDSLPYISKIVDTRGLDALANSDRKDLYQIFREDPNNIIILIDKFAAPSLSMIDLLNTYAYDENLNLIDRLIYMVNFRNNEPNLVVGVDGTVDDESEGIAIRKKQVIRRLAENRIPFNEENILFYNPLRFLDSEKKLEVTLEDFEDYGSKEAAAKYKCEIIEHERREIVEKVSAIVLRVIDKYKKDIDLIKQNLEKLKYNHESSEYAKDLLKRLVNEIEGYYQNEVEAKEKVLQIYNNYFESKYPSTIRAINNRHGVYNNHDIYQEGAIKIEDLVKFRLKDIKDDIVSKLNNIRTFLNVSSSYEVAITLVIEDINKLYEDKINQINQLAYDTFQKNVFSLEKYEQFWNKANYRWGQGSGYRLDIIEYYQEQIKVSRLLEAIESTLEDYVDSFIQDCIQNISDID